MLRAQSLPKRWRGSSSIPGQDFFQTHTWLLKRRALITCIYSGYICISLPGDRLEELELPLMVPNNEEKHKTAYTLTVDYKHGG